MKLKKIVMWALTYDCNMNCTYCQVRGKKRLGKDMTEDECILVAKMIAEWNPDAVWITGGEPTIKTYLPSIIELLNNAKINVVLNTNGMISQKRTLEILAAAPRGITVSLDSALEEALSARGESGKIILKLKEIAKNKKPNTILGTAIVLTRKSVEDLYEYASFMEHIGVDYISLNPLYGVDAENERRAVNGLFMETVAKIRNDIDIMLPSEGYIKLLDAYYSNYEHIDLACPAYSNYFFIAPWGSIYPCSNEIWHYNIRNISMDIKGIKSLNFEFLNDEQMKFKSKTNKSDCFGARCIGSWKLYYDNVFTRELYEQ